MSCDKRREVDAEVEIKSVWIEVTGMDAVAALADIVSAVAMVAAAPAIFWTTEGRFWLLDTENAEEALIVERAMIVEIFILIVASCEVV